MTKSLRCWLADSTLRAISFCYSRTAGSFRKSYKESEMNNGRKPGGCAGRLRGMTREYEARGCKKKERAWNNG